MIQTLFEHYRVPEEMLGRVVPATSSGDAGFFRFGPDAICYGHCASGVSTNVERSSSYDAFKSIRFDDSGVCLPFDPAEVIENLRRERYEPSLIPGREKIVTQQRMLDAYYFVRRFLPVTVRRHMQRVYFSDWKKRPFPTWPVDSTVDALHHDLLRLSMEAAQVRRVPFIWFWPDGAPNCVIVTHDVETQAGRDFTTRLMDLDDSYGFRASFQIIPEKRYDVPDEYVREIKDRGFEFNIHDLNHDGHLYQKREEFLRRATKINEYVRRYGARGFRAGSMYRIIDWYDVFEFSYDMSLSSVAHLEPKRGGCCTVFPFFIGKILELPLTTSQDYSIFHILNEYSIDLWKKQLALIRQKNGLMSFIAHPDYLINGRARDVYESLLSFLRDLIAREKTWAALPGEVDEWWRVRSKLNVVRNGNDWSIEGRGKERARLAYAVLDGGSLTYEVAGAYAPDGVRP